MSSTTLIHRLLARWPGRSLAMVALAFAPAWALADTAQPRITSSRTVSGGEKLTAEEKVAVRTATGDLMRHVAEAKVLLAAKNKVAAGARVEQARALVRIIDNALPFETIKTTVRSGTLSYEDTFERKPQYVPIYSVAEDVSVMRNVQEKPKNATQTVDGPVFTAEELVSSSVQLNLPAVRAGLDEASKAIAAGDLDHAKRALSSVRTDLRTSIAVTELPAARARANLHLAQEKLTRGQPAQARLALEAAGDACSQIDPASTSKPATELHRIGDEMTKLSRAAEKDFKGARKQITEWLEVLTHA